MAITNDIQAALNTPVDTDREKAKKLFRVIDQMQDLQSQKASLVESLSAVLGSGAHDFPGVGTVTFAANNAYDTAFMAAQLKPGQLQRVTERKVSNALVKKHYPEVYEASKTAKGLKLGGTKRSV